jgi:Flp pilus assembly protein TadG
MAALIRRFRKSDDGAELIEMAIVTPLLLFLILSIVDFGFLFQRYVVLTNAAAEGARVASLPGYTSDDVTARVSSYATNGGIVDGVVNTTTIPVNLPGPGGTVWPGRQVTVTHVYNYQYIGAIAAMFSGTLDSSVTITSRSTVRQQVAAAAP